MMLFGPKRIWNPGPIRISVGPNLGQIWANNFQGRGHCFRRICMIADGVKRWCWWYGSFYANYLSSNCLFLFKRSRLWDINDYVTSTSAFIFVNHLKVYAIIVSTSGQNGFSHLLQVTTTYQTAVGIANVLQAEHNLWIWTNLHSFYKIQPTTSVQQ